MKEVLTTVLTFLMGFVTAVFAEPIRKRLEKTKISIAFDPAIDIIRTPDGPNSEAIYLRMKVTNEGSERYVKQIRCYLIMIERFGKDEKYWSKVFDVPLSLAWSYLGHVDSIDLPPTMWAYFDVLKFDDQKNCIEPATIKKPLLWQTDLSSHGEYKFTYYLAGENVKQMRKGYLHLKWNGQWDKFELLEVNNNA